MGKSFHEKLSQNSQSKKITRVNTFKFLLATSIVTPSRKYKKASVKNLRTPPQVSPQIRIQTHSQIWPHWLSISECEQSAIFETSFSFASSPWIHFERTKFHQTSFGGHRNMSLRVCLILEPVCWFDSVYETTYAKFGALILIASCLVFIKLKLGSLWSVDQRRRPHF